MTPSTLTAQSSRIPAPESVVGFAPGAESKLATYEQTVEYFKKLDAASDQMMMVEAGTSTQCRTYYFALISSKDNLKKIDRYREIARSVGHTPRPPIILTNISVAENREEAQERAVTYLSRKFDSIDNHYHFSDGHLASVKGY